MDPMSIATSYVKACRSVIADNKTVAIFDAILGAPFLGDEGDEVAIIEIDRETRNIKVTDYDGEVTDYDALQP